MEKRYDSEIFQILHYFNNYLDTKSKVELRKAEVWVSLMKKSVDELNLFTEFYVDVFYRSVLWRIYENSTIPLTEPYRELIERIHRERKVSSCDDYILLVDLLSAVYLWFTIK